MYRNLSVYCLCVVLPPLVPVSHRSPAAGMQAFRVPSLAPDFNFFHSSLPHILFCSPILPRLVLTSLPLSLLSTALCVKREMCENDATMVTRKGSIKRWGLSHLLSRSGCRSVSARGASTRVSEGSDAARSLSLLSLCQCRASEEVRARGLKRGKIIGDTAPFFLMRVTGCEVSFLLGGRTALTLFYAVM